MGKARQNQNPEPEGPKDHNILCLSGPARPKIYKIVFSFGSRAARRL